MKAIELFEDLEKGILHTIKAAEVYALHVGSIYGHRELNQSLIQDIITDKAMSGLRVLILSYSQAEKKNLADKRYLLHIGNQILLATYTALEMYLISKIKEYARYRLKGDKVVSEKVLEKLPLRSLDRIKEQYADILEIYLPQFEIECVVDEHSSFNPTSTWDGIKKIEKARHEIAHDGKGKTYKIRILPDVWDPFDFVRRWVALFDTNFDILIYEGRSTRLIQEYEKRVAEVRGE